MPSKTDALLVPLRLSPVIPVVTVEDARHAIPLARTLAEAGVAVVEVTLRSDAALDAIAAIAKAVPEVVVAAGTVLSAAQAQEAVDAGARFLVTPGASPRLAEALAEAPVPALPGCATTSEAMALAELGFGMLKFFPAGPSGGLGWLKSVAGPLPHLRFCPTGGVDAANASSYLALPNVLCVGGSWIAPAALIAAGDYATIGRLAREATSLARAG